MKKILLRNGNYAIVDDEDYSMLSKLTWKLGKAQDGTPTIFSINYFKQGATFKQIKMHNLIVDPPKKHYIFHRNRNPLDNTKGNLKILNSSQHEVTKPPQSNNQTGLKGVSWHTRFKKWQATIQVNGRKLYLGRFIDIRDAANAYNEAALKHYGDYAYTNDTDHINIRDLYEFNQSSRSSKKTMEQRFMDKMDSYKEIPKRKRNSDKEIEIDY